MASCIERDTPPAIPPAQFYEQRASDETARHFLSADYDTRQKLALAGRMLAREARQYRLKPKAIEATFIYFARQIRRDQGDEVIK